jgi:hypothetical protein
MAMEIKVSAVMTRGARARVGIEDRSLVILAVPFGHPGMSQTLLSQDFRFWASLPASRITLLEMFICFWVVPEFNSSQRGLKRTWVPRRSSDVPQVAFDHRLQDARPHRR